MNPPFPLSERKVSSYSVCRWAVQKLPGSAAFDNSVCIPSQVFHYTVVNQSVHMGDDLCETGVVVLEETFVLWYRVYTSHLLSFEDWALIDYIYQFSSELVLCVIVVNGHTLYRGEDAVSHCHSCPPVKFFCLAYHPWQKKDWTLSSCAWAHNAFSPSLLSAGGSKAVLYVKILGWIMQLSSSGLTTGTQSSVQILLGCVEKRAWIIS